MDPESENSPDDDTPPIEITIQKLQAMKVPLSVEVNGVKFHNTRNMVDQLEAWHKVLSPDQFASILGEAWTKVYSHCKKEMASLEKQRAALFACLERLKAKCDDSASSSALEINQPRDHASDNAKRIISARNLVQTNWGAEGITLFDRFETQGAQRQLGALASKGVSLQKTKDAINRIVFDRLQLYVRNEGSNKGRTWTAAPCPTDVAKVRQDTMDSRALTDLELAAFKEPLFIDSDGLVTDQGPAMV